MIAKTLNDNFEFRRIEKNPVFKILNDIIMNNVFFFLLIIENKI